jgi:hypothetical protein
MKLVAGGGGEPEPSLPTTMGGFALRMEYMIVITDASL